MSEALVDLIRRAEEQKLQLQMHSLFTRNMVMFKNRFPDIYKTFNEYKPSRHVLKLDPNGKINLVDTKNRSWMYNGIPQDLCKKQIDAFERNGKVRKFQSAKSPIQNERHIHIRSIASLINHYTKKEVTRINKTPELITNLIVSGVGLGYHLLELVSRFNIKNILIHEHCKDTFYASLFTINWEHLVSYFSQENRSIIFCIGVSPKKSLEQIELSIHTCGLHSHIFTFILSHTQRQSEKRFIKTYNDEIRAFIGGLGYFDDERIGLAHAHHNIQSDQSVFVNSGTHRRKTRLIIVGSGPSLDFHIDYLKKTQKNAVIFSCGTALATLLKNGIKPDFHVEMERPAFVKDAIELGSTREQRKGISLLCLHTVSPETIACFDEACYALKPNDAGNILIREFYSPLSPPDLAFSNPTVTNCALAFSAYMGFQEIHLVGVDLGLREEDKHHSTDSIYYELAKHADKDYTGIRMSEDDRYHEGNFGGEVRAPLVLDMARSSMERLLEYLTSTFPGFKCYNSNDGVKIAHTISKKIENMPPCKSRDKTKEVATIKRDHFFKKTAPPQFDSSSYLSPLFSIENELKLSREIETEEQLYNEAARIFKVIDIRNNPLSHFLMRGTINCFLGAIFENTLYCVDHNEFKERLDYGVRVYNNIIRRTLEVMKTCPFEIDDTVNERILKVVNEHVKEATS